MKTTSNSGALDTARGIPGPVLDAYRDGGQLAVWCEHDRRWHRHGTGDGHRGAHCTCPGSPYRASGYYLREAGALTPAAVAAHPEAWPCIECMHDGLCSCAEPRCPDHWLCAAHADPRCPSCWTVHGGQGYGHCRQHGLLPAHAHADGLHCPACWAEGTLRGQECPAPCRGCRELVTGAVLARVTRQLDDEAAITGRLRAFLDYDGGDFL
jgi:hypothetical protein